MFQADNKFVNPLDALDFLPCPPCLQVVFHFFNPLNHFSLYTSGSQATSFRVRACRQRYTHCLPRQFSYTFCFIWCSLFDISHLSCYYCLLLLLLLLLLSTVHLFTHRDPGKGKKTFSALHIDGWNWDLNCFWGLIWLNTLHIVKSRFLFEKIVCVQLHIFILLHSTVQIISFGKISTFIEKKAEILLLKQILKDIILNHWTRAFFQWYQVRINLQHLQKKEIKFHASVLPEYYKVKWILIGVKELTTNGGGVVRAVVGSSFIFRMLLCTVVWPYSYCMS